MTPLQLNDNQLDLIESAASCLLKPKDIARLLSLTHEETEYFLSSIRLESDEVFVRRYFKAVAEVKFQLHESVVKLALKGSPAAQPIAENYLREQMQ